MYKRQIKKHELIVISDEIYAELSYEDNFYSLANFDEIKDQVIIISGFSKAYACLLYTSRCV